jgi:hypothetical protein
MNPQVLTKALIVLGGCIAANFIWQVLTPQPDFGLALERSWFQAVALALCVFAQKENQL